jgi:hypothetical protein
MDHIAYAVKKLKQAIPYRKNIDPKEVRESLEHSILLQWWDHHRDDSYRRNIIERKLRVLDDVCKKQKTILARIKEYEKYGIKNVIGNAWARYHMLQQDIK